MTRRRSNLLVPLALAAVTATVLAGCGSSDNSPRGAAAGSTTTAPAPASTSTAEPRKQPVITGSYRGKPIRYFDFGDIKLEGGNDVAAVWTVTNGAAGQRAIFDSLPGRPGYSALRQVNEIRWSGGTTPRLLTSVADVRAANAAGDVTVHATGRTINAPVLEFGQERHAGFARNETIHYYELGKVKVASGNEILPIWTFTNGVAGQGNIADTQPGTTAYPPLWAPVEATWSTSATPRLITSFEELTAAEAAGELTLTPTSDVVNCPFL